MAPVLDGIEVLDLSWGIAGPMATMLLADHGARVTRIEVPGGGPLPGLSGYQVWNRGKRRADLDLRSREGKGALTSLAIEADVLVESMSPGTTTDLGIDYGALAALNPRLIYCSITGYGSTGSLADRPGYDALVAARSGLQYEVRGVAGGTLAKLAGVPGALEDLECPPSCLVGARRPGPLFNGMPWVSLATMYLATLAINAALRVRERTGRGQHVETSLLQGALLAAATPWQRVERMADDYQSWVIDPRAPKGIFRARDGRWVNNWAPLPSFLLGASEGDTLAVTETVTAPRAAATRLAMSPQDMVLLHHYDEPMREAVAKFDAADWVEFAAEVGVPLQVVCSPEEALADPLLLADGCVAAIDDPELGPVRQVGTTYTLSRCPGKLGAAPVAPGSDTAEVLARAEARAGRVAGDHRPSGPNDRRPPLDGITVLDLGLAMAAPFGASMLSDLGANVIKVNSLTEHYWMGTHLGMAVNRGKRGIALNLKDPAGLAILHRLVEHADVVSHNMRYAAAQRLGIDFDTLRTINPALIYCHTRGYERGRRDSYPGNDQMAAALTGTEWVDGATDNGGMPIWAPMALGDNGCGMLSAIGVVQALYHRDRTGEGQLVDTSIMYAHLLHNSSAWITDGDTVGDRPKLDEQQLGYGPLYRLYETADGWLCVAALTDGHWRGLCLALERPALIDDPRFATARARARNTELGPLLEPLFAAHTARECFALLDDRGVPCEISSQEFVLGMFDDPEMIDRGWVSSRENPLVGRIDMRGVLFDFSETPGRVAGGPIVVGQHSREILRELDFDEAAIDELVARGVVGVPQRTGRRR